MSTMRKVVGLGLVGAVGLGIVGYLVFRQEIHFYGLLYNAYRTARQFYAEYEHLARDVVFDPEMAPRLDVYSPPTGKGYPVLVFVHGGSWKDYDKELFAPVAMKLLPEEMVVVIPDYTLYPHAGYEQMAREVAAALSWTLEHIDAYGGDPRHVVVAGHSAGGHLAALAVMDPRFLEAYGHSASEICGVVGMSGVYDVQAEYDYWQARGSHPQVIEEVMGGEENFDRASPLSYARADLPPILLIHGEEDETVPVGISIDFHGALQAAGAESELAIYEDRGHTDYLFAGLAEAHPRLVEDLVEFVYGCPAVQP